MTNDELQRLLDRRTRMEQRVYEALRQSSGPLTDGQLRVILHSTGSGPRDALVKLLPTGIVRQAGKTSRRGNAAMMYEDTPIHEIDDAAMSYAVRQPRKRVRTGVTSKLNDLRRMEPGDFPRWHENRKHILQETKLLVSIEPQMFWECARPDEIEMVREEVAELRDWANDVLAAIGERAEHEKTKETIEKLGETNGRTHHEIDNAQRLAAKLSRKLL